MLISTHGSPNMFGRLNHDLLSKRGVIEENENIFSDEDKSSHFGSGGGPSAAIDELFARNR